MNLIYNLQDNCFSFILDIDRVEAFIHIYCINTSNIYIKVIIDFSNLSSIINTDKKNKFTLEITSPGEYEFKEIYVLALETLLKKEKIRYNGYINLLSILVDEVNILYCPVNYSLTEENIKFSRAHYTVLLVDGNYTKHWLSELQKFFNPNLIVYSGNIVNNDIISSISTDIPKLTKIKVKSMFKENDATSIILVN